MVAAAFDRPGTGRGAGPVGGREEASGPADVPVLSRPCPMRYARSTRAAPRSRRRASTGRRWCGLRMRRPKPICPTTSRCTVRCAQAAGAPQAGEAAGAAGAAGAGPLAAHPRRDRNRCRPREGERRDRRVAGGNGRDRGEHPGHVGERAFTLRRAPERPEEGSPRVPPECRRGVSDHRRSAGGGRRCGRVARVRAGVSRRPRARRCRRARPADGRGTAR